jgi:DNA-directed RNA polymerase specialized sigma24 family protein
MTTFRRWLFGIAERNWHARAGTRRRVVVGTGLDHTADPGEPTADHNPKVLKDSCEAGERIAPREEQLNGLLP